MNLYYECKKGYTSDLVLIFVLNSISVLVLTIKNILNSRNKRVDTLWMNSHKIVNLGGDRVFSKTLPSFHSLLEDSAVTKVTFDCRCDSNALFHQFGVFLAGGSTTLMPPKNNIYFTQAGLSLPPFFQAWKKCCHTTLQKLPLESRMLHTREIQMFDRIDHSQWLLSTMLVTMWM